MVIDLDEESNLLDMTSKVELKVLEMKFKEEF